MINLLPTIYREGWRKLLRFRLINLIGLFIWGWVIFVAVISFGLLYTVKQDRLTLEQQIGREQNRAETLEYQTLVKKWREVGAEAKTITTLGQLSPTLSLMAEINSHPAAGVTITALEIATSSSTPALKVGGVAAARSNYLALVEWLKGRSGVAGVIAPVDNLIKDHEIDFSVNLILATPTPNLLP